MLRGAPFIKEQASKVGKEEKLKSFRDNWTENSLCPINPSTLIYWIKVWIREIPWYLHFSNLLNEPSQGEICISTAATLLDGFQKGTKE